MYNSVEFAKYIAAFWNDRKADINMTKIQKLLYIAYGTWLAVSGDRLVKEHPQAWPHGPVFPTTRNKLLKEDFNAINYDSIADEKLKNDTDIKILMEVVFKKFGTWTAYTLSNWSHKEGSPWEYVVSQPNFKWGEVIPDDRIKSYFKKIVVKND